MITNAHQFENNCIIDTPICVIGGGAAGISIALDLEKSGLNVLLLESGGLKADKETQSLSEGYVTNDAHYPLNQYHLRQLGGKTAIWGGRCVPFDELDFETREHVPFSGWPISKKDLDPYYAAAQDYLLAGEYNYDALQVFGNKNTPMIEGFQDDFVNTNSLERFSLPVKFGSIYYGQLKNSKKIRVILMANCTHLALDDDENSISHITAKTISGKTLTIKSKYFILAMGALDSTRVLLASNDKHSNGIGNYSGYLGKFYMDHIYGTIGTLKTLPSTRKTFFDYEKTADNVYCRKRITITRQAQEQFRLLNFAAFTNHNYFPSIEDPDHGNGALSSKFLANKIYYFLNLKVANSHADYSSNNHLIKQHVLNLYMDLPRVLKYSKKYLLGRIPGRRKLPGLFIENKWNEYPLFYQAEQAPNINSTVSLSKDKDALGLPRLIVNWQYLDIDIDSIVHAYQIIDNALQKKQCGLLNYDKDTLKEEIKRCLLVGNHPNGTTRMSKTEKDGIVDPDCKVFGVSNLFIASSSVFPTSGHANPTLTIVAIAMKVADKVKKLMKVSY